MTGDQVTEAQRRLRDRHGIIVVPRCRAHFRAIARWWELEAMRGYVGVIDDGETSSDRSNRYARNYRWLVELMDTGRRVSADAHGVYVDGELASVVQARGERAEARRRAAQEKSESDAKREASRPPNPYRKPRRK